MLQHDSNLESDVAGKSPCGPPATSMSQEGPHLLQRQGQREAPPNDRCSIAHVLKVDLHAFVRAQGYSLAWTPYSGYFVLFGNGFHLYFLQCRLQGTIVGRNWVEQLRESGRTME